MLRIRQQRPSKMAAASLVSRVILVENCRSSSNGIRGFLLPLLLSLFLMSLTSEAMYTSLQRHPIPKELSCQQQQHERLARGAVPIYNEAGLKGKMHSVEALMQISRLKATTASSGTEMSSTPKFRLSNHFSILRDDMKQCSQWILSIKGISTENSSRLLMSRFGDLNVETLQSPYYRVLAREIDLETFLEAFNQSDSPISGIEHVNVDYKLDSNLVRNYRAKKNPVGARSRCWTWNKDTNCSFLMPATSETESFEEEESTRPFVMMMGLLGGETYLNRKELLSKWEILYATGADATSIEFSLVNEVDPLIRATVAPGWTSDQILSLARRLAMEPQVYWISRKSIHVTSNYFASGIGESGNLVERTIEKHGITGKGMLVGCVDTGIYVDHSFFNSLNNSHPLYILNTDLKTKPPPTSHKISAYIYSSESDRSDTFGGHGTHVSGTLAGLPLKDTLIYPYRGIVQDAQLVFFDVYNGAFRHDFLDLPVDMFNDLYAKLHLAGAKVTSNSWGSSDQGYSLVSSYQADRFMYVYNDSLLVYAAGNDGIMGRDTINEPASAKNVIAVGATGSSAGPSIFIRTNNQILTGPLLPSAFGLSISQTPVSSEFYNIQAIDLCSSTSPSLAKKILVTQLASCDIVQLAKNAQDSNALGLLVVVPDSYPDVLLPGMTMDASPIKIIVVGIYETEYVSFPSGFSDGVAVSIRQTDNNIDDVTFFSSRGPSFDNRIKPDLVAPGDMVSSSLAAPGFAFQQGLFPLQGTSMATPIVSGLAVLLQEYFQYGHFPTGSPNLANARNASGSLLKAMLVNSARRMNGVARVVNTQRQLTQVSLKDERFPFIYQGHGRVNISNVMYFHDSPFSLSIKENSLSSSQRHSYQLNITKDQQLAVTLAYNDPPVLAGSSSVLVNILYLTVTPPSDGIYLGNNYDGSLSSPDLNNNLQKVIFKAPESGVYTIQVVAHSVPLNSPQSYSLVYTVGNFEDQGNFGSSSPSSVYRDIGSVGLISSILISLCLSLWLIRI